MKTILLILPYGGVGGMERVALTFYNYYKNKNYNVKVIKLIGLPTDIINFDQDEIVLTTKDLWEMSVFRRLAFYIKSPIKVRKIIKQHNIEVSIAFGDVANAFSALVNCIAFYCTNFYSLAIF